MTKRVITNTLIVIWLIYTVLATFNLLASNPNFTGFTTVRVMGEFTNKVEDKFWLPGHLFGFALWPGLGGVGIFIGQIINYLVGRFLIVKISQVFATTS